MPAVMGRCQPRGARTPTVRLHPQPPSGRRVALRSRVLTGLACRPAGASRPWRRVGSVAAPHASEVCRGFPPCQPPALRPWLAASVSCSVCQADGGWCVAARAPAQRPSHFSDVPSRSAPPALPLDRRTARADARLSAPVPRSSRSTRSRRSFTAPSSSSARCSPPARYRPTSASHRRTCNARTPFDWGMPPAWGI